MIKYIFFLLLASVFISCSSKSERKEELADFLPQNEVEQIAKKIEQHLQNKQGTQIYSLFDGEEFYERLSVTSRKNPKVRKNEVAGIAEDNFVRTMSGLFDAKNDSLKIYFIEAKKQQGNYIPLSFVFYDTTGVNFFDLFATRNDKGKIVICDYLSYMSGQESSKTVDEFVSNRTNYGEETNSKLGKALNSLVEIGKLLSMQNYDEAYSVYQQIPSPFNKQVGFLTKKLRITQNISNELYIQTLKELIKSESCLECKSLYKFYIAVAEEDKAKRKQYWNELKSNYSNGEKLNEIEKSYFSKLDAFSFQKASLDQ